MRAVRVVIVKIEVVVVFLQVIVDRGGRECGGGYRDGWRDNNGR